MAAGIVLIMLGAILAFAVRVDATVLDLQTVGLIFMVTGAAIIAYARKEKRVVSVETRVRDGGDDGGAAGVDGEAFREVVTHEVVDDRGRPSGPG